ncbi:MAG: caspase family protein [Pseudomonadota bacterium]
MLRRVLLYLIAGFLLLGEGHAQQRIALVIGNSDYAQTGWDLRNPANDAEAIARSLTQVGFEVQVKTDLTQRQMQTAFKEHGDRLAIAGEDAIGFVFYAGHGVQSQGLNYLIPTDAEVYTEADIWAQAPRLDNLFRNLERAGNATNFVVLDACRNNNLLQSNRSAPAGLASAGRVRGTLIAYSTQPGAVAEDGAGENSPYTSVLASVLREPGLSAEDLFRTVATRVEAQTNNRQQPWTESGLRGEQRFCFAGCDVNAGVINEDAAFGRAVAAGTDEALSDFLGTFPSSRYANQIETLRQSLAETSQARTASASRTFGARDAGTAAAGLQRAPEPAIPVRTGAVFGTILRNENGRDWVVTQVAPTSPFKGKLIPGDVLKKIDAARIGTINDPAARIETTIAEQERVSLIVDRNGVPFSVMVR